MTELEYRTTISKELAPKFIASLEAKYSKEVVRSVSLISNKLVNEFIFEEGKLVKTLKRIKNQKKHSVVNIGNFRVVCTVSDEIDTESSVDKISLARIKYRYRYDCGHFYVDVTFTDSLEAPQLVDVKKHRTELFALSKLEDILAKCEKVEVEFEAKDAKTFDKQTDEPAIFNMIKGIEYSPFIYVADLLGSRRPTLKGVLPSVKELDKFTYSQIDVYRFCLTDKADGVRMILILSGNSVAITSDTQIPLADKYDSEYIFDCEYIEPKYMIFDVLMFAGQKVLDKPFAERWNLTSTFKETETIKFKKYYFPTDEPALQSAISEIMETKREYETDGVIFSSVDKDYRRMMHYKWKPLTHLSIDFVCKLCRNPRQFSDNKNRRNQKLYILFNGCGKREARILDLDRMFDFRFPHSPTLTAVPFSPSSDPKAYLYWSDQNLDDKVVEFIMKMEEGKQVLSMLRIRDDRADDYRRGTFGNYFKIAEGIWENFRNPLTLEVLSHPSRVSESAYFQTKSDEYKNVRRANNNIKRELIEKYGKGLTSVVDIACGKGQDMGKFYDTKITTLIMIDPVADSLSEVVSRKWDIILSKTRSDQKFRVYTIQRSILDPVEDVVKSVVEVYNLPIGLVTCNLAIHYFAGTKAEMTHFCKVVNRFMVKGSRLIITSFDGQKVFDMLKETGEYASSDGRFNIVRKYGKDPFTGNNQVISVKLPFSKEPVDEYLVNYSNLFDTLGRMNINLVISDYFMSDQKDLTDEEKKYISLHRYAVFEKVKN